MPADFGVPFIPQGQISQQILGAIQQANEDHAQQQAAAAKQRSLDIAQQEANTASQHLATTTPLIQAQTTNEQLAARATALRLAQEQNAQQYVLGDAADTQPHPMVAQAVGALTHPDVPTTPPQPDALTVSNPMGENLAVPAPPVASGPISTDASSTQSATPSSGPTPKIAPVDRDTNEAIRLAGGASPSELSQIQFLRQQLSFNPTHDGTVNYWNGVHALLQKRLTDPVVAASIGFQRQGMSETDANAAAVRNQNIATQLDKMDADPTLLTSDKAPAAVSQLKGLLTTPNLTPDVRDHIQRNLAVAQNALSNAIAFDAAKKKAEDDIANGNPKVVAQLLVSGDAAWSQLVSTRKPEFLVAVATEAKKLDPNFSVAANEAAYKQATNPQVRSTLDMIQTMTDRSGSIAIAEKAAEKLPQLNSQQANSVFNSLSRSFGNNSVTNFHTAMMGLADEYSKVMGGGVSSDTGRQQALDLLKDAYSSNQLSGAIETMKQDISARKSELIRGNRTLEQTYGAGGSKTEPVSSTPSASSAPPSGATHTGVSSIDGKTYYLDANNNKLGVAQ
jgi:hypothetical protein